MCVLVRFDVSTLTSLTHRIQCPSLNNPSLVHSTAGSSHVAILIPYIASRFNRRVIQLEEVDEQEKEMEEEMEVDSSSTRQIDNTRAHLTSTAGSCHLTGLSLFITLPLRRS
jgi:hypothetical protein